MKLYIDIILSGENFDPQKVSKDYDIIFRKYRKKGEYNSRVRNVEKEGYAILSSEEEDTSEDIFKKILEQYDKLYKAGEKKLGIENKEFYLYVESLQNNFVLQTKYLKRICTYFSEINISYIDS